MTFRNQALPRVKVFADFHCVTRWSRLGHVWDGVTTRELLGRASVQPEAKFVVCHGYDNHWTTNLPLADFLAEDALLADLHAASQSPPTTAARSGDGAATLCVEEREVDSRHRTVEFDRAGYWERGGYHMRGDPWAEERFG